MRPDRETDNAFIYCLAFAARKASISIVCVGTLSNHYHAVVVDNHGRLPQTTSGGQHWTKCRNSAPQSIDRPKDNSGATAKVNKGGVFHDNARRRSS